MSENKAAADKTVTPPEDDRVDIYIPKGSANEEPNLFVGINGVNYLLPKGKTSKVPKCVAKEVALSLKAQSRQDENMDKLLEAAK